MILNDRKHVADVYDRPDMLEYYDTLASHSGLWEEEQFLIRRYFAAPGRLLIVGCGTGRETFHLHHQDFHITGIDIARQTLLMARKKLRKLPGANVNFQQADVVHLPYRDRSFDNVLMLSQLIQHIPQKQCRRKALGEIVRVLKPGGHCILSAFNKPISFLYLLLLGGQYQRRFLQADRPSQQKKSTLLPGLLKKPPIIRRLIQRIAWEIDPIIWNLSDHLPLSWRVWFFWYCTLMNAQRRVCAKLRLSPPNAPEVNDFMLDHRTFRFHYVAHEGDLYIHFPDVSEMLEDIAAAGFEPTTHRSLEELRQGTVYSEKVRRLQRLIFYVVQKRFS